MALLDRLRCFRERGWTPIDAAAYAEAWQRFGGSVATHPAGGRLAGLAVYAYLHDNDRWPMGPAEAGVALPPCIEPLPADALWSPTLDAATRLDKAQALAMQHDLTVPLPAKKRLRRLIQRALGVAGRPSARGNFPQGGASPRAVLGASAALNHRRPARGRASRPTVLSAAISTCGVPMRN
ncbi:hypothetical protein SSTU70S_03673 [Stutzerimonas stutzeri]